MHASRPLIPGSTAWDLINNVIFLACCINWGLFMYMHVYTSQGRGGGGGVGENKLSFSVILGGIHSCVVSAWYQAILNKEISLCDYNQGTYSSLEYLTQLRNLKWSVLGLYMYLPRKTSWLSPGSCVLCFQRQHGGHCQVYPWSKISSIGNQSNSFTTKYLSTVHLISTLQFVEFITFSLNLSYEYR